MSRFIMKYSLYTLLLLSIFNFSPICTLNKTDISEKPSLSDGDRLNKVRTDITLAINKISDILNNLCASLHNSIGEESELVCQQLSILDVCTQTIGSRIPDMSEKELLQLLVINDTLLEQIKNQIMEEQYTDFSDINASELFGTMLENKEGPITIEQLENKLKSLEQKISLVAGVIDHLVEKIKVTHSTRWWHKIGEYKGTLFTITTLLGCAYLLRHHEPSKIMKTVLTRLPIYTILSLYLLRQKKDADTQNFVNSSFGENSTLAHIILSIKQAVGSPREKRPAVHIIARDDMNAQEQIKWAKDNNCEYIKTDYRARSIPYLCNFFDLDDSLFRFSFNLIFAQQVRADVLALSECMGDGVANVIKKILNPAR